MVDVQKPTMDQLNKTTNTIILDYVLWLSAKTILSEAITPEDPDTAKSTKGRRLVGLADGLILTFDTTNRPKFSYPLLTRRLDLAALVILFVYRDSRSRYITRRSSETSRSNSPMRSSRSSNFLRDRNLKSVISDPELESRYSALSISQETTNQAKLILGITEDSCTTATATTLDSGFRKSSLNDALDYFIAVSCAACATKVFPKPQWSQIAIDLSLFAALESILVFGAPPIQSFNEAFCYGPLQNPDTGDAQVDAVFRWEGTRSFKEFADFWDSYRDDVLDNLRPPPPAGQQTQQQAAGEDLSVHLLSLLKESYWPDCRRRVIKYLDAVLDVMPVPELSKYSADYGPLDKSVLRAPGMIAIRHEDGEVSTKKAKISV